MKWLDPYMDLKILLLLGVANTMPIVARHIFKDRFATPVDLGVRFLDGRPVFGPHKTWRGLVFSIFGTWLASYVLELDQWLAARLAFWSMAGDLLASFIKRRRGLESGARCTGVDQAIEAFVPLSILRGELSVGWLDVAVVTGLFTILEIVLSPFFYKIGFRRNPY